MPLYEYACQGCRKEVELLVRSEAEPLACPECGGEHLTKLFSVPVAHSGSAQASAPSEGPPAGPCGSGCGCFPQG